AAARAVPPVRGAAGQVPGRAQARPVRAQGPPAAGIQGAGLARGRARAHARLAPGAARARGGTGMRRLLVVLATALVVASAPQAASAAPPAGVTGIALAGSVQLSWQGLPARAGTTSIPARAR